MAKHFTTSLDNIISKWAERKKLWTKGQAGFRRNHRTCDHIFMFTAIIEEANTRYTFAL